MIHYMDLLALLQDVLESRLKKAVAHLISEEHNDNINVNIYQYIVAD